MYHTNIIAMKDLIISEIVREKKRQLVIANTFELAKVEKISSLIDLDSKYM